MCFFFLIPAPGFSEGLRCFTCVSEKSWDECEKQRNERECPRNANEVCVKEHKIENNNNGKQAHVFAKYCGEADQCTNKHCLKEGSNCVVDCCHNDLCNAGVSLTWTEAYPVYMQLANIVSIMLYVAGIL